MLQGAKLLQPSEVATGLPSGFTYLVPYVREDYEGIAKKLNIFTGMPRTAHHGLVITFAAWSRDIVFVLVDRRRGEGVLPDEQLWRLHPDQQTSKAGPGESCDQFCGSIHKKCTTRDLEFANTCEALKREFPCEEGCGHQVGNEIPCYVHDGTRDTALQCLVTDAGVPSCSHRNSATTRLCVCVPP